MYEPIFPGFDPFIEDQIWAAFQSNFVIFIQNAIVPLLMPKYDVQSQPYFHLLRPEHSSFRGYSNYEPIEKSRLVISPATRLIAPSVYEINAPLRVEIYNGVGKLVTVIEVFSPFNKEGASRERYLINRSVLLNTDTHLIELDFLRKGKRLEKSFPEEGYVALVARALDRGVHVGEVYEIGLRDPLPVIPIPLDDGFSDVPLDLASIFKEAYIRARRYRLKLNYEKMPQKKFSPEDQAWIEERLKHAFAEDQTS